MINGPDQIYIEKKGKLELVDARFATREALIAALRNIAQYVGKHVDEERPILEGRLPDGSRVEAVLPPAAPDGPYVSIRRFFKETLTVERLIGFGALTDDAARRRSARSSPRKLNIAHRRRHGQRQDVDAQRALVVHPRRRARRRHRGLARAPAPARARRAARGAARRTPKGRGDVTIRDLFRATLRMRPDRIVVGEIRGGEALDLIQAMTSAVTAAA